MAWLGEIDLGTKAPLPLLADAMVTLTVDGALVTVPEGTSVMRAVALMGTTIPKCARPTTSRRSDRAASAWSRWRGAPAITLCTTPVLAGMVMKTDGGADGGAV